MKFSKILGNLLEEIFPDWRDRFLSYKSLKKQLNLIYPKPGAGAGAGDEPPAKRPRLSDDEATADTGDSSAATAAAAAESSDEAKASKAVDDFVSLLQDEIEKFNEFFVQKEEDIVIAWKELQDRIAKAKDSNEDLTEVGRNLVNFHGEMVLLEIYSILNYTGLVKITKKHDKRSGSVIQLSFIQSVVQEPFFSTEVLKELVEECARTLDNMFSKEELAEIDHLESTYARLTQLALRVLEEIRSGSSTVGPHSLPPLETNPVVEQAAK
ncbi:SPX domain-containing protein 1 [Morus notabilis]|nr:SPX domain-containing protein 1 [Morus notabilis]